MEKWFILSFLSAIVSSFWSLSVKYGLEKFNVGSFAFWYSAVASILITINTFISTKTLALSKLGSLAGLGAGVASFNLAKSIAMSPNPGYCMAVFRMQAILTTLASVIFYNAKLNIKKYIAIFISVLGVITIVTSDSTVKHSKKEIDNKSDNKSENKSENSKDKKRKHGYDWILYAIIAGLSMTTKDLFTKKALTDGGKQVFKSLFWSTSIFQTLILLIILLFNQHSLDLFDKTGVTKISPININVVLAGVAFTMYQLSVIVASKYAPNVGLVKSIDSLGIVITSLLSVKLFGSSLDMQSIIGMIMVVAGVIGLAF